MSRFYTFPLHLSKLIEGHELNACDIRESVRQYIRLIVTTTCGELCYDENFGCGLWDYEFDNVAGKMQIKDRIRETLEESIRKFEQRLVLNRVKLNINEEELGIDKGRRVKRQLSIEVNGVIKKTGEHVRIHERFFIGPYSR